MSSGTVKEALPTAAIASHVLSTWDSEHLPRVVILGAGPAGLGAAWQLVRQKKADVTVLEQRDAVGGNAGTFEIEGLEVDYGSHRLHPSCQPEILADLRELLNGDLLNRPRHGRIRLHGKWIHFPLKMFDLVGHLPPSFAAGVVRDSLRGMASRRNGHGPQTFASVLERSLGATICEEFYFPYARKIWGMPPEELSATQAQRRVSARSIGKMVRKALRVVPNANGIGGSFFYPRHGYGQISRAMAQAAVESGAKVQLKTTVSGIQFGAPHQIEVEREGQRTTLEADIVWSTLPISLLARIATPKPPEEVLKASESIQYRSMVLIYLVLEKAQWTPFDAHYFPETQIKLTRLSEPKNYSGRMEPANRTVLCGELPCALYDEVWCSSDDELAALVAESLERCGLPLSAPVRKVVTRRLSHAYPIYRQGYEKHFALLDEWSSSIEGLLSFGRQGLFAHDNTHHALAMAYAAVDCLTATGSFCEERWREYREEFTKHVVED